MPQPRDKDGRFERDPRRDRPLVALSLLAALLVVALVLLAVLGTRSAGIRVNVQANPRIDATCEAYGPQVCVVLPLLKATPALNRRASARRR
jgi:hypothetical protein